MTKTIYTIGFTKKTAEDFFKILEKNNIDIDRRKIELKEGIKAVGEYEAVIRVHPEITSKIKVHIIAG